MQIDEWKSSFPEDFYLPAPLYADDYVQRVFFGINKLQSSSVTIGFMSRNIGYIIPYTLLRIARIANMFKSHYIYALENNSNDDTRQKIREWCFKGQNRILIGDSTFDFNNVSNSNNIKQLEQLPYQEDKSFARRQRMSIARNILRDNMLRKDTDFYMIIDADIIGGFSYEGIANSFSYEWDMCASNSIIYKDNRRLYYDSWAYRDIGHPETHEDSEINPRIYNRGDIPIQVLSAFGGLGIYNNKYFPNKIYRYLDTDCDHPTINLSMSKDGANIIMNPSMISLYNKTRYVI